MATQGLQGHVKTTDSNGESLLILFLLDKQEDVDEVKADLTNQVSVLKGFATAWNSGTNDIKGKSPLADSKPANVLVVIKQQHLSSHSPNERIHITVKPASKAIWDIDPPSAKGVVHVYSKDDTTGNGYESWFLQATKKTNYASWKDSIETAMNNSYV